MKIIYLYYIFINYYFLILLFVAPFSRKTFSKKDFSFSLYEVFYVKFSKIHKLKKKHFIVKGNKLFLISNEFPPLIMNNEFWEGVLWIMSSHHWLCGPINLIEILNYILDRLNNLVLILWILEMQWRESVLHKNIKI